ncbi:MAG TPA: MarR family transcriptional regulator [Rubrivivax sp.]|nr:MarR family transcriptional regulator [Rubrivivax sp.]
MPQKTFLRNLLLRRFNWVEEHSLELARAHGYGSVTPALSRLFGNMGGHPAGLSDLSRRMGISRQAVHKLANEAAKLGLVEFVPSVTDTRVVCLQFTKAGWTMSADAARSFEEIEARIKSQIGAKNLIELKRLLALPWDATESKKP